MKSKTIRVLVVDDNEQGRYLLTALLHGLGHEVVSAQNGAEALDRLRAQDFDLIITDILMPIMDGFQFCMHVKQSERLRLIPLVFYTATYVDEHDETLAVMMGAHTFIRKPVEPEEFTRIINEVVAEISEGRLPCKKPSLEAHEILMERYNERVVNKLHEKMQDLEEEIAHRKQVEEELRAAQRLLSIRDRIGRIILTVPDERMYGAVLEVILEAVESEYGIFGYVDDAGQYVCPSMTRNVWDQCQVPGKDIVFPVEKWVRLWGAPLSKKETFCANQPLAVPEGHVPITRAMAVPMVYREATIGGFVVANKPQDYEAKDRELLETLADYVAPVLHGRLIRDKKERERRQAEDALRESEERYRIVANFTYDWDYWLGPDGGIIYMSPSCERVTGYSSREFIDDPGLLRRIVHPADREHVFQHFSCLHVDLQFPPTSFDFKIIHKDGTERWINHVCRGVVGYNGEPRGRRISGRDITDRKQAEESLKESEGRYRLLTEEAPIGIGILQNKRHIYVNPAFVEVFGYETDSEILNRPLQDLVASQDWGLISQNSEDMLSGKPVPSQHEVTGLKGNGDVFDLSIWPRRINYLGQPAILTFVADRTEAKSLRAQLFQAQKMEAIGALAGGVAHDFNNLLQVILGYTELLLMDTVPESRIGSALREIAHSARSGAELIRGLLTFSRRAQAHFRPINLNQCVEHVNKLLLRTIFKATKVETFLDDNLATINADPTQMEQVLMNLAVNARDAMADAGTLTIETRNITLDEEYCRLHLNARPGDYVMLGVSDTGQGMERRVLEHIFEPFFSTKAPGKGTGLGLAIVYGIVGQHGGHITCQSKPGRGTVFSIFLPVMARLAEATNSIGDRLAVEGTETILLVDDEQSVRKLGQVLLTRFGYKVLVANSGQEALDLYSREHESIALVILDLIMPVMGGKQCLEELLKINPKAKVVIATGYSVDGSTKEAIGSGASAFIRKPYEATEILRVVRDALDEADFHAKRDCS